MFLLYHNNLYHQNPGTLNITARPISIHLTNQTFEYLENIDINPLAYTVTSGSIVNSDNLNLSITTNATNNSPVGTYSLTLNNSNPNYLISATYGNILIVPKVLIVTSSQSGIYGATPNIDQMDYSTNKTISFSNKSKHNYKVI